MRRFCLVAFLEYTRTSQSHILASGAEDPGSGLGRQPGHQDCSLGAGDTVGSKLTVSDGGGTHPQSGLHASVLRPGKYRNLAHCSRSLMTLNTPHAWEVSTSLPSMRYGWPLPSAKLLGPESSGPVLGPLGLVSQYQGQSCPSSVGDLVPLPHASPPVYTTEGGI